MYKKALEQIQLLKNEYYDFWEDVVNLESPTDDKKGVDACGAYYIQQAKKLGWKTETFPQSVSGDVVCITINPEVNAAPLTLSGHIDTVHPVGSFGAPAARRDEEKIYGPGATDCKGGTVAGFLAMRALWEAGYKKRPVQLLLQTDEETSSKGSQKATIGSICERAKDSIAFINLETSGIGRAVITRKGSISFRFTVTGIPGHSSRCCTEGASAIREACHKILLLEELKDDEGITCSCGIINGGTAANTIPGECSFIVNLRFATQKELNWLRGYMQEVAENNIVPECRCKVEEISFRICMEKSEKNDILLEKVNAVFEKTGLPTLTPIMLRGGSDAADASAYGIPCLDSQGVRGKGSHTKDEHAFLSSLEESATRAVALAYYLD